MYKTPTNALPNKHVERPWSRLILPRNYPCRHRATEGLALPQRLPWPSKRQAPAAGGLVVLETYDLGWAGQEANFCSSGMFKSYVPVVWVHTTGYGPILFFLDSTALMDRSCCYSQNTSLIYHPQSFSKHPSQELLQFKCGFGQSATFQLSSVAQNLNYPKPCNWAKGWSYFLRTGRICGIIPILRLNLLCLMTDFLFMPLIHRLESTSNSGANSKMGIYPLPTTTA